MKPALAKSSVVLMTMKRSGQVNPSKSMPRFLRTRLRPPSQATSHGVFTGPALVSAVTPLESCVAEMNCVEKRTEAWR